MTDAFLRFAASFASRRYLRKKVRLEVRTDAGRVRLFCDEPAIVARFASELRQLTLRSHPSSTRFLMRGQAADHVGMIPGLFRGSTDQNQRDKLLNSEKLFEQRVRRDVQLGRFKRHDLGALLQHYGYRTSWLDVVDSFWVALWFATNSIRQLTPGINVVQPRTEGSGWLYFLVADDTKCRSVDLRQAHHGLSLRPHTQGGWSVQGTGSTVFDLAPAIAGCVEFPIDQRWFVGGHIGRSDFLFPGRRLDDTLNRLLATRVDAIAKSVEEATGLAVGSLGRVYDLTDH